MRDIVVQVENLGKLYHIGLAQRRRDSLRETLAAGLKAPLDRLTRRETVGNGAAQDTIWALKDVSFDVQAGEVVGIIGRNGAGKSTLLKILSRITEPTTGRAVVRGRVGSLLEVGTGFHPELTGRENIYMNGAILGMRRAEIDRKFDEIVAFSEIEQFLDTPVKRYSSGMYVRLAFAVAAHLEPEILIMDEVLAVGDASFQKKCLGKMGDVAHAGRTVLFVSHNMAAVAQLCRQAVWIDKGMIRDRGGAEAVIKSYLTVETTHKAECTWADASTAPGDDRVRFLAARIVQAGHVAPIIDINAPCQVELEFRVLREVQNLVTGVSLYNETDVCLFNSCDWRPNHLRPGVYHKSLMLPPQALAEGSVNVLVQLHFYDPDIRSAVLPNTLRFEAIDSDHPDAVRGLYKGHWPGLVRLRLPWTDAVPIEVDTRTTTTDTIASTRSFHFYEH